MKRRNFLKKAGLATAGAFAAPYILPSGRLFASTGTQFAEHVIFVLFAGGVKQQESVLQEYIHTTQFPHTGNPFEQVHGNIMYNMLEPLDPSQTGLDGRTGTPDGKVVYGTGAGGSTPIAPVLTTPLESESLYFPEMTALTASHYGGLNQLLQGNSAASQGLKQKPVNPTIFEYARRHAGYAASKVWFVGHSLSNSVPLLNYSLHPDYGPEYGANMFIPNVTFGSEGQDYFSEAKIYHPEDQLEPIYEMKAFLDQSFDSTGAGLEVVGNTPEEKQQIKEFMKRMYEQGISAELQPNVMDNGDLRTVAYAAELIKEFQPNLLAVSMSGVDGCHANYTGYLSNLHRADHAVGHLWNLVKTGKLGNLSPSNTAIIIAPECGRNIVPNPIKDDNQWFAYDHAGEPTLFDGNGYNNRYNTKRVFGMAYYPGISGDGLAGKKMGGIVNGDLVSEGLNYGGDCTQEIIGQTTDCMFSVADFLGFKDSIPLQYIEGGTMSMRDRALNC